MAEAPLAARLEARLDGLGLLLMSWWAWPALLVVLGTMAAVAALAVSPVEGGLAFGSVPFGQPCTYLVETGLPCPSCGMTRSWVWTARGHLLAGLRYSPAGATLWIMLVAGGGLGALRLALRRPALLALPWRVFALIWALWLLGPYALVGAGRMWGLLPPP